MENMFKYCKELNSLDVHNWETSLVENMGSMFESCENLESLVLSNFNTAKIWKICLNPVQDLLL